MGVAFLEVIVAGRPNPDGDRGHVEMDLGLLAGVSDRGHRLGGRNEDAMALATCQSPDGRPVALAVVCDGLSVSPRSDEASLVAAQAAIQVLLAGARTGTDPEATSLDAVRTALGRLRDMAGADGAPACTYASAVVGPDGVTVCWLGDCRVYWLAAPPGDVPTPGSPDESAQPAGGRPGWPASRLLTSDDSLAAELVASGLMSEEEAIASPQAHVIIQWLGADATDPTPHVAQFQPAGTGAILVCSDGLSYHHPEAGDLAGLALPAGLTNPLDAAIALVQAAYDARGLDNITAVLVPFPPSTNNLAQVSQDLGQPD
jgi:serine/threonine protein phosphatase PrpC